MTVEEIIAALHGLYEADLDKIRHHIQKEDEDEVYLGGWGISDLTDSFLIPETQAHEGFAQHEKRLAAASCLTGGWPYIEEFCDYPKLDDCEDCPRCGKTYFWARFGGKTDPDPEATDWVKVEDEWICQACAEH